MSAAQALPRPVPAGRPQRATESTSPPRLRVVRPPAQSRSRAPFVLLCMGVLAASLLGTLLLNTAMAQGEYERFSLQTRLATSAQNQQELAEAIAVAESPEQLSRAARELGMVPSGDRGYLRLADGAVLGDPTPAVEEP
ncbi:hypothetical protein [Cellulomonas bogoriensis]|uniref:Cell division protein FtsL n=2 Tax=Cellulomonas bogoriensis TaxID=301388 RepID=A0A0A0BKX7_9CELL|nr:hypothetical protein N869_12935 [Cellulomonas bogoriensis 69B4 = DSM 16987]